MGKASKKQKKLQVGPRRVKIQMVTKALTESQEHASIKRDQIYNIPTGLWLKNVFPIPLLLLSMNRVLRR